jgi:hypothetical protein
MFIRPFKHIRYNFTFDFFQKKSIYPFYEYIHNNINSIDLLNKDYNLDNGIGDSIHEIKFIPTYFALKFPISPSNYKFIKFSRVENFQINLEPYDDVESYLKKQMSSKNRSQLKKRINRLEQCFDIRYAFYCGDISKQKYDMLFRILQLLIERRFKQRGDTFSLIEKWDDIKESSYQMILEKKASLFVIYDQEKPISINLRYHFDNILNHLIRSYDIDYSKFGVGQTAVFKELEWCFSNNVKIFDLMWGELDYKIFWTNVTSKYEHHFIYKKNHPFKTPYVKLIIKMYKLNDFLIKKGFYILLYKTKVKFREILKSKREAPILSIEKLLEMPLKDFINMVNVNTKEYAFLRKHMYDFQYLNFESNTTIDVFKVINVENTYIIRGSKQCIKIIVK